MEYILLTLSWTIFYVLHSLLASSKLKRILRVKIGSAFKWYRLFYSVFSLIFIVGITVQSALIPKMILLSTSTFSSYLGYLFAAFGTIILVKSAKQISLLKFIGFDPSEQIHEKLVISGIYSKIRHPLYAGLILVFLGYFFFSGSMTAVVHLACLLAYLPFGIYFEEKNLIAIYGDQYKVYRTKVPAIFPWI